MKTINDIPDGHMFPMERPSNAYEDRILRNQINKANNNGDSIINVGNGYYRAVPGDPVDEKEFEEYLAIDLHRARATLKKRLAMKMAFEKRRECAILTDDLRTVGQP